MTELEQIFFQKPYQRDTFFDFLHAFLPDDFSSQIENFTQVDKYKTINTAERIGQVSELNDLSVIEITHNTGDARIAIATDAFKLMADNWIHQALVVFKNDTNNYRFSYLTIELDEDSKGKVVQTYSNPRRYSFFLGVDAKVNTPYQQLVKNGQVKDVEDLRGRFSLEVVNKEFYKQLVAFFNDLTKEESGMLQLPGSSSGEIRKHFAVRLIGRIIFSWFLKQKKSEKGQLVPDAILSSQAVHVEKYVAGYYHDRLERLFFELLNTSIDKRDLRSDLFDLVPYLNGGLFAPHSDDFYELDRTIGCSKHLNTLIIDDDWFVRFFDFLETYNFTIDENTAFDQDLSIDPEMLGRIFENLLAEIDEATGESARKATGSFYTPREVVDYMVDESLLAYLGEKTNLSEGKLKALVSYDRDDDYEYPLSDGDKKQLVNAVANLKTLDPACGSGAFPIGMLQKLVYILYVVDEDGALWRAKRLENVAQIYRQSIEAEFDSQTKDYIRKIELIEKSIFGVDIQPIAVEVARLRTFLTLMVDEQINDNKENRGIKPLPNLEFKFVSANTLIPLPESSAQTLFDDKEGIQNLSEVMSEYFSSREKEAVKVKFQQIQKQIFQHMISIGHAADMTQKLATWDPFSDDSSGWFDQKWIFGIENGFDIVIGNPPYVSLEKVKQNKDALKEIYKVFAPRGDLYTLFYERGLALTKSNGLLVYITSNKWMRAGYGEKLRGFFSKNNPLKLIDFSGFKVFESATVDTNILLIQNTENQKHLEACRFKNDYQRNESIPEYFDRNKVALGHLSTDIWFIGSNAELNLKKKIEEIGTPLKDWGVKISYGIKTGFNKAFIITKEKRDELVDHDPKSAELIKPILRGRDIRRYNYNWNNLYIIIAKFGSNKILEKKYPAVYEHLNKYSKELKARGQCKYSRAKKNNDIETYSGQHHWLELDNNPGDSYLRMFEDEKITWPDIMREPKNSSSENRQFPYFCFDSDGVYQEATNFIMTGNRLRLIVAILNSKTGVYFFTNWFAGPRFDNKGFRYKKVYLENFLIPKITPKNQKLVSEIETLVVEITDAKKQDKNVDTADFENQIEKLVMDLYELTKEEKEIVRHGI